MLNEKVVVLNKYDEFWTEFSVAKAVKKIMNNRATSVIQDKTSLVGVIKTGFRPNYSFTPLYKPLVIRLNFFDYYKYTSNKVPYSDYQVFLRDKNTCQYWHDYILIDGNYVPAARHKYVCKANERTIDHVIPLSRGGKNNSYENQVCCCDYCNRILKKNLSVEEAGLILMRKPKAPVRKKGDIARSIFNYNPKIISHQKYKDYLKGY